MNKKGLSILMRAKMRPNNDPSKLSPFSPTLSVSNFDFFLNLLRILFLIIVKYCKYLIYLFQKQNGINQMMTDPPRNQRSTDDSRSNFSASGNHYERS
jgi:malonyl-CoA decarboxylase